MKKVLVINSSARGEHAHSRKLTEVFVDHWSSIQDNAVINFRELGNADVPHVSESWLSAASRPAAERSAAAREVLRTSDTYIAELRAADIIVLGAPMYNWSVPSTLKAYIDQVLRVNETWKFNPTNTDYPYIGLLENKILVLLLSRGGQGYEQGEPNAYMNFQSTYLKTVFNVIGIRDIHQVAVNGASFDREKHKIAINAAHQEIKDLIDSKLV